MTMPGPVKTRPSPSPKPLLQLLCIVEALATLQPDSTSVSSSPSSSRSSQGPTLRSDALKQAQRESKRVPIEDEYTWQDFQRDRALLPLDELVPQLRERRRHWYDICAENLQSIDDLEDALDDLRNHLDEELRQTAIWKAKSESLEWKLDKMTKKRVTQQQKITELRKKIADLKKAATMSGDAIPKSIAEDRMGTELAETDTHSLSRIKSFDNMNPDKVEDLKVLLESQEATLNERTATIKTLSALLQEEQKTSMEKDNVIVELRRRLNQLREQEQKYGELAALIQKHRR